MKSPVRRWLLRCFPAGWRAEYGEEFEDLLNRRSLKVADVADIFRSACREWAQILIVRFSFALIVTGFGLFVAAVTFAPPVWRALSSPAVLVLREHGFRPPALVNNTPYEGFAVVYLGMPLLFAVFAMYPFLLAYTSTLLLKQWQGAKRSWAKSFSFCSAIVFVVSLFIGFMLWRGSLPAELLLAHGSARPTSVGVFFRLMAISSFLWVFVWQVPVFILFGWRWNALQSAIAHSDSDTSDRIHDGPPR